ncbi:hypothetical protein EYF80_020574 [Liparis tanakae]|uniref:Uncharacterized protein n=1 Tax=Liparis tanakae TaxID=230148 RepID=A0A4Z2HUA6_9TELE|nr:hypothetical protein EYF80_020574 [Liparis tanakae]
MESVGPRCTEERDHPMSPLNSCCATQPLLWSFKTFFSDFTEEAGITVTSLQFGRIHTVDEGDDEWKGPESPPLDKAHNSYTGPALTRGPPLFSLSGPPLELQLGSVSNPSEAACCLALRRRFSMLVVLLLRLPGGACISGLFHTCWACDRLW